MGGQSDNPPRTLSESSEFSTQKNKLLKVEGCQRLDEVMSGLDIGLCRFPERYPVIVKGTNLRMFLTKGFKTIPSFRIFYTFTDTEVTLIFIEKIEED